MTEMKKDNAILILAGPSAGGKTATAAAILASDPRFSLIRSGTTRARRGDGNDAEYLYYTEEEFRALIEAGELAEYTNYGGGKMYGTPKSELRRAFGEGKIPLLVLDLNGVRSFASLEGYSPCTVYVYADLDTVEQRLYDRNLKDSPDVKKLADFVTRKEQNIKDYLSISEYAPYMYAFLENKDTLAVSRDRALSVFAAFCNGAPADLAAKQAAVLELTREGRIKKRD